MRNVARSTRELSRDGTAAAIHIAGTIYGSVGVLVSAALIETNAPRSSQVRRTVSHGGSMIVEHATRRDDLRLRRSSWSHSWSHRLHHGPDASYAMSQQKRPAHSRQSFVPTADSGK
jgi:hypothetical protein